MKEGGKEEGKGGEEGQGEGGSKGRLRSRMLYKGREGLYVLCLGLEGLCRGF